VHHVHRKSHAGPRSAGGHHRLGQHPGGGARGDPRIAAGNPQAQSDRFTTTPDLTATFPAEAAREIGLQLVPLLCASEIAVPGRLTSCIRVMLHLNTTKSLAQIIHVYLREAKSLRPDIHSAQ
jgi:hypothetical protein